MDGERYVVEMDLTRVGDLGVDQLMGKISRADKAVGDFKRGWRDLGVSVAPIGDAIDSVASKVWGLAKAGAVLTGGALFAGATYGVTHLNNELEKSVISLGTIFSANGIASNVPQGMVIAKDTIAKMRIDAQKLPGEFEELQTIFTTGAIPAFHSGASVDRFRDLAAKAMAAGKVAQMDNGQVAREFAQLLEGRSGAHNVFGMKLLGLSGDKASAFNKMAGDKRLEMISKELDKYSGSITAFGDSFDAVSSTLVGTVKNIGQRATAPLFADVKGALADANAWFDKNRDKVDRFADRVGEKLHYAFVGARKLIDEWWPAIEKFGEGAYDRFVKIWQDAKPYIEEFGAYIKKALEDPNGTIDKLITLVKLYAALKGAEAVGGAVAGTLQAVGGVAQMASALKMMGYGGGATTLAARAGGALYGAGAAAAPYALAGAVPGAIAGGLWYGAFGGVPTKEDHYNDANNAGKELANETFERLNAQGKSSLEMWEQVRLESQLMRAKFQDVTAAAYEAQFALRSLAATQPMSREARDQEDISARVNAYLAGPLKPAAEGAKKMDPKHKGGGGGTIQKVEIVVTSNQHPSRIARAVVGHMVRIARNPTASPDVRNYSALEDI